MTKAIEFICPLPNGIHARPANHLENACKDFQSQIVLRNVRNGLTGSAKSVLSLVGTDTLLNDPCVLEIDGDDAEAAFEALSRYIVEEFPHCDEALEVADDQAAVLPQSLMAFEPQLLHGKRLSQGIAKGQLIRMKKVELAVFKYRATHMTFDEVKANLSGRLQDKISTASGHEKEITAAHLAILNDDVLNTGIQEGIRDGKSLAQAIIATAQTIMGQLAQASSQYLKERALDIEDIAMQLLVEAHPDVKVNSDFTLSQDAIVLATDLTPSQFLGLDRRYLKGLILTQAGSTSHTVILARAFNIPAISGIEFNAPELKERTAVYLNADLGIVAPEQAEGVNRYFERAIRLNESRREKNGAFANVTAQTRDGHAIEIAANIACVVEAAPAFAQGAEGIGLFRTEMLFMDRKNAPDEAEQFEAYKQVLEAADGKAVIIRTMDIGGDKPIDYLRLPEEHNPFLGYRAVRIYPEFLTLFTRKSVRFYVLQALVSPK